MSIYQVCSSQSATSERRQLWCGVAVLVHTQLSSACNREGGRDEKKGVWGKQRVGEGMDLEGNKRGREDEKKGVYGKQRGGEGMDFEGMREG